MNMFTFAVPRLSDNVAAQGFVKAGLSAVVTLLGLVVIGAALLIWHDHRPSGSMTAVLTHTYCSSMGKVCFSYPKEWRLSVDAQSQATVTDPTTGTSVDYSPQLYTVSDPCGRGGCLFKTLSLVISNGFANADDVAGIFQKKGDGTFTPEYFLIATKQLQQDGLSVGSMADIGEDEVDAGFVNGRLTQLYQTLGISPPSSMSFTSLNAAQDWLSSQIAQTAAAIVNSARPRS